MGNEHGAMAVQWASLAESAEAARTQPEQFASAFKQVFEHELIVERIREAIKECYTLSPHAHQSI